jgi:hypothetical protein
LVVLEDDIVLKCLLTASILALLAFSPASFAQTADGITPAEETVCDELSGALYGLCVAYCEAMDCHLDDQFASDRACERVLTNYMTHSDGDMPPCHGFVEGGEDEDTGDTGDTGESSSEGDTTGGGEEGSGSSEPSA